MLRYIYADDLNRFPKLAQSMFEHRAAQFHDRLKWEVTVHDDGTERDEYDEMNPLYVIWEQPDGRHGGSMRFLPTTGDTMVNDHFLSLTDGVEIRSPFIWECTRFCLAPATLPRVSAALMLGGMELGRAFHLSHAVGVFDARMVRVYRRLGWGPVILGSEGEGKDAISVGLWAFEDEVYPRVLERAGIQQAVSESWLDRSLGRATALPKAITA